MQETKLLSIMKDAVNMLQEAQREDEENHRKIEYGFIKEEDYIQIVTALEEIQDVNDNIIKHRTQQNEALDTIIKYLTDNLEVNNKNVNRN